MSANGHKEPGIFQLTLMLTLVTGIAGVVLGLVAYFTVPIQIENDKLHRQKVLQEALPEANSFVELERPEPENAKKKQPSWYRGLDAEGNLVGYVIQTDHRGYAGPVELMVGVGADLSVKGYAILHHNETPGLGDAIERPRFIQQFVGKRAEELEVTKRGEPGKINAVTGATITTNAVVFGIRNGLEALKPLTVNP